jgi:hypothetical protein
MLETIRHVYPNTWLSKTLFMAGRGFVSTSARFTKVIGRDRGMSIFGCSNFSRLLYRDGTRDIPRESSIRPGRAWPRAMIVPAHPLAISGAHCALACHNRGVQWQLCSRGLDAIRSQTFAPSNSCDHDIALAVPLESRSLERVEPPFDVRTIQRVAAEPHDASDVRELALGSCRPWPIPALRGSCPLRWR